MSDACRGKTPRNSASPLVHLRPGVPNGKVRFSGGHALEAPLGIAIHGLGKCAHDAPPAQPRWRGPQSDLHNRELCRYIGLSRRGFQIAAVSFRVGWGVNRLRPYRAEWARSKIWITNGVRFGRYSQSRRRNVKYSRATSTTMIVVLTTNPPTVSMPGYATFWP